MTAGNRRVRREFDADYYRRFYEDDPVHTAESVARLASAVDGMCSWWGVPVRTVLDIGAGPGHWRDWYREHRPGVKVTSIDVSEHACRTYGHQRRDISAWRPRGMVDLVVCHGVLHYLDDAACESAIDNIGATCRGAMYLEAPTKRDLAEVVDAEVTDLSVRARTGSWYRKRLEPHFVQAGAGIWVSRRAGLNLYELEGAGR